MFHFISNILWNHCTPINLLLIIFTLVLDARKRKKEKKNKRHQQQQCLSMEELLESATFKKFSTAIENVFDSVEEVDIGSFDMSKYIYQW